MKTYAAIAKEFRELAKATMADCKKNNRTYHYKHRGCEIIMLDKDGCRHEGFDPDYLDMGEVSGKRVKEIVDHFRDNEARRFASTYVTDKEKADPLCGFSLDGGIDCYDSFSDAMKYPDDYEPFYDSYDVGCMFEEVAK